MAFRIDIPLEIQAAVVERAPAGTLAQLTEHLHRVAQLAEKEAAGNSCWVRLRDPETGLLRWDGNGCRVYFDVLYDEGQVRVLEARSGRGEAASPWSARASG